MKESLCRTNGVTLIVIPYWWDNTIHSIAHEIHTARPDTELPLHLLLNGETICREIPHLETKRKEYCICSNRISAILSQPKC